MSHHGGRLKAKKGKRVKGVMRLSMLTIGRTASPGRICPENRTSAPSRTDDRLLRAMAMRQAARLAAASRTDDPLLREIAALSGETDRKITRLSNRIDKLLKDLAAG